MASDVVVLEGRADVVLWSFLLTLTHSVETLIVDFHTHSLASDGALSPRELLEQARGRGIEQFAITDHDTIAGWESLESADYAGLSLISGVELSCVWGGSTVHVIGLGFDPHCEPMQRLLKALAHARQVRGQTIAKRLEQNGMPGAWEGATKVAGRAQLCRPHFALWMVQSGFVDSVSQAFDRYLGAGKLGDVKTHWPLMKDVLTAIKASNGLSVLAHPLHYKLTRTKLRALCAAFVEGGGEAIEVINGRQSESDTASLCRLAREFACQVSVGSDFHREWRYGTQLGIDVDILKDVQGVWEQFL